MCQKLKLVFLIPEKIQVADPINVELNVGYVDLGLSNARQEIARQLMEAKTNIPHTYSTIECNVDDLIALCNKFDHPVSIYDFVIKAAALALHVVPSVNASWSDDRLVQLNGVNIGIAVDSPNGVITPVINNVDQLDVSSISHRVMVCMTISPAHQSSARSFLFTRHTKNHFQK